MKRKLALIALVALLGACGGKSYSPTAPNYPTPAPVPAPSPTYTPPM